MPWASGAKTLFYALQTETTEKSRSEALIVKSPSLFQARYRGDRLQQLTVNSGLNKQFINIDYDSEKISDHTGQELKVMSVHEHYYPEQQESDWDFYEGFLFNGSQVYMSAEESGLTTVKVDYPTINRRLHLQQLILPTRVDQAYIRQLMQSNTLDWINLPQFVPVRTDLSR